MLIATGLQMQGVHLINVKHGMAQVHIHHFFAIDSFFLNLSFLIEALAMLNCLSRMCVTVRSRIRLVSPLSTASSIGHCTQTAAAQTRRADLQNQKKDEEEASG